MYKKILLFLFAVILFTSGCGKKEEVADTLSQIQNRGYIKVGVRTDAYPFGYTDKSGNYDGFDIELARVIAQNLLEGREKVKFIPVTSYDRMSKLYTNDVDMIIATMSVTPKRREIVDFSTSYHTSGQALLVKKGSKIKSLKALKGKRVIIVFGSTSENSIRAAVPHVQIIGYKTYPEAFKALKQDKGEAILADDTILLGLALKDDSVQILPKRYTKEPYAVAFRKEENSKNLLKNVNNIIETQSRIGNLKKMKQTYGIK